MKVAELEGMWLDMLVARAEGRATEHWGVVPRDAWYCTRWEIAGPIIERERIVTFPDGCGEWTAFVQKNPTCGYVDTTACDEMRGPTLLIAAMRSYVASKFGDEVPDEVAP